MKTTLFGKSNAVLTELKGGVIAIIECDNGEDITLKIKQAIKDHFVVDTEIVLDSHDARLTNQEPVRFSADFEDDGEPSIRDFEIEIVATYN